MNYRGVALQWRLPASEARRGRLLGTAALALLKQIFKFHFRSFGDFEPEIGGYFITVKSSAIARHQLTCVIAAAYVAASLLLFLARITAIASQLLQSLRCNGAMWLPWMSVFDVIAAASIGCIYVLLLGQKPAASEKSGRSL